MDLNIYEVFNFISIIILVMVKLSPLLASGISFRLTPLLFDLTLIFFGDAQAFCCIFPTPDLKLAVSKEHSSCHWQVAFVWIGGSGASQWCCFPLDRVSMLLLCFWCTPLHFCLACGVSVIEKCKAQLTCVGTWTRSWNFCMVNSPKARAAGGLRGQNSESQKLAGVA
jgi:hypothetical protein